MARETLCASTKRICQLRTPKHRASSMWRWWDWSSPIELPAEYCLSLDWQRPQLDAWALGADHGLRTRASLLSFGHRGVIAGPPRCWRAIEPLRYYHTQLRCRGDDRTFGHWLDAFGPALFSRPGQSFT